MPPRLVATAAHGENRSVVVEDTAAAHVATRVEVRTGTPAHVAYPRHRRSTQAPQTMDIWTLIERDHRELALTLGAIAMGDLVDPCAALDGARLGFAAHAEAHARVRQDIAGATGLPPHLAALFRELEAGHDSQERQLARLAAASPGEWRTRAAALQNEVRQHHDYERAWCLPVLRARSATFSALAATYATERLRALAWAWRTETTGAELR